MTNTTATTTTNLVEAACQKFYYKGDVLLAGSRTLRYWVDRGEHVVATYRPAGEDIAGPSSLTRCATVQEAREAWKKAAAYWINEGYVAQSPMVDKSSPKG